MIMMSEKTNTWSNVRVYKVTDKEKYVNSKDSYEHLELIREESKGGKVIWEKVEGEDENV